MRDKDKDILPSTRMLIVCEGLDAKRFLEPFLKSQFPQHCEDSGPKIQVFNAGGNEDIPGYLESVVRLPGFDRVESLLIIRDAEKDAAGAAASVKGALERVELSIPPRPGVWSGSFPKVAFLLFPTLTEDPEAGTLEDLCLRILRGENSGRILEKAERFITEISCIERLKWPHKAVLHAYFSATDRCVGAKLGEAAGRGAFDWDNDAIRPLYDLIKQEI